MQFAGMEGFGQGMNQGMDIMTRLAALQQIQQQRQARTALGRALPTMGGAPPPPMPGMPPVSGQPPMPGEASVAAGPPMPQMGGPAPPMPMAGPPEMGGMPQMGAPAPPMPQMGAEPMLPPEAPPGAGGDPLPAAQETGKPSQDAQSVIANIAQQIKAANPDIDPESLFDATNLHIEQMKGVRNDVKDYMFAQVEMAKAQIRLQQTEMRVDGQRDVAGINAGARIGAAEIGADSRENVAQTNRVGRNEAAGIRGDAQRDVAGTAADARVSSSEITAGSRESVARTNRDASDYRADQGYRGRVDGANAYNNDPKRTKPGRRYRNEGENLDRRDRQTPGGRAPAYKSAQDVAKAYQAGKLSRDQAAQILRQNGWAQ